jgi:hypothetical protein
VEAGKTQAHLLKFAAQNPGDVIEGARIAGPIEGARVVTKAGVGAVTIVEGAVAVGGKVRSLVRAESRAEAAALAEAATAEGPRPIDTGTPPSTKARLSPSNYPVPDPPLAAPPVRFEPSAVDEVVRMRKGKGPTTKADRGDLNIEAHHRGQQPTSTGGVIDELEMRTHRGPGNHARHSGPTQLTPAQRAAEIREHWRQRGAEYLLPGEGI